MIFDLALLDGTEDPHWIPLRERPESCGLTLLVLQTQPHDVARFVGTVAGPAGAASVYCGRGVFLTIDAANPALVIEVVCMDPGATDLIRTLLGEAAASGLSNPPTPGTVSSIKIDATEARRAAAALAVHDWIQDLFPLPLDPAESQAQALAILEQAMAAGLPFADRVADELGILETLGIDSLFGIKGTNTSTPTLGPEQVAALGAFLSRLRSRGVQGEQLDPLASLLPTTEAPESAFVQIIEALGDVFPDDPFAEVRWLDQIRPDPAPLPRFLQPIAAGGAPNHQIRRFPAEWELGIGFLPPGLLEPSNHSITATLADGSLTIRAVAGTGPQAADPPPLWGVVVDTDTGDLLHYREMSLVDNHWVTTLTMAPDFNFKEAWVTVGTTPRYRPVQFAERAVVLRYAMLAVFSGRDTPRAIRHWQTAAASLQTLALSVRNSKISAEYKNAFLAVIDRDSQIVQEYLDKSPSTVQTFGPAVPKQPPTGPGG